MSFLNFQTLDINKGGGQPPSAAQEGIFRTVGLYLTDEGKGCTAYSERDVANVLRNSVCYSLDLMLLFIV